MPTLTTTEKTGYDTHVADSTKHFTQSEISITESQISDLGNYETADATIVKTGVANTFTAPQRTSITAEYNAIDFTANNNFEITATAANITVANITGCTGQGGEIKIHNAENITGWGTEFKFKTVPTGLTGTERFGYIIESETEIGIGWVQ